MDPMQRYTDRRVLITGGGPASTGLCAAHPRGGRVVSADISERGLADTATKAGDVGGRLTSVKINVGDEKP